MYNVDVEIYLSQFISFFEKNPDELTLLIGNVDRDDFFDKVKEQSYKNLDDGEDVSLTKKQILEILVELRKDEITKPKIEEIKAIFLKTEFGEICLN